MDFWAAPPLVDKFATTLPLTLDGRDDYVLLASCLGDDTGGGVFAFNGCSVERVDTLSTTGMFYTGEKLLRVLWSDDHPVGEVLVYDQSGVQRYYRVDGVSSVHDVALDQDCLLLVSTGTNRLVWLNAAGELAREWKAPGDGDAWHLNSVFRHNGELYVSAFGRFENHREWAENGNQNSGIIFNLKDQVDLFAGLSRPHNPRWLDGAWTVCNSGTRDVLELGRGGSVVRRVHLDGWTRGLAVCDLFIFVGESGNRHDSHPPGHASIVVVDRQTWRPLGRLSLPSREIYDLVLVPRAIYAGLMRGFRTNPLRSAETEQYALFRSAGVEPVRLWATGKPLPPEACRVHVDAELPTSMDPKQVLRVPCSVENTGSAVYVTALPYPVHFSYKWIDQNSGSLLPDCEGLRTPLYEALGPGQKQKYELQVQAPEAQGDFILRLTLVQENVAWFDTIDDSNGFSGIVRIGELTSRSQLTSGDLSEPQLDQARIGSHGGMSLSYHTGSDSFISTG